MERRRPPSPSPRPRDEGYRRMEDFRRGEPDRRGPPPRDMRDGRRRPRSMSPPERYPSRRSPPPSYNKRYRREDDYMPPRYDRAPSPPYRRSPDYGRMRYSDERPPYRDEPRGPPPPQRPDDKEKPLGFRDFMLHKLDDDVSPDEAQKRYQQYLALWWGSQVRAEFEQRKNDEQVRSLFDPRQFEKALTRIKTEAQTAAEGFAAEVKDGKLDPTHADFNQGAGELAPKSQPPDGEEKAGDGAAAAKSLPLFCWSAARVATDLKLSTKLVKKLDQEKDITENALLETADADAEQGENGNGAAAEADVQVDESNLPASTAKLDLLLTYLWRVHGVDYYGGVELDEHEYPNRLDRCRTLRGPSPEEGEEGDAEEDKQALAELEKNVDARWEGRLESGCPLLTKCQRQRIDDEVEAWIKSQIVKHDENKWGSKLSQKMFVGEKFVIKHIRLKHESVMLEERDKIIDNIFWENFKAAKEEEEKRHREEVKKQQAARQRQMQQHHAALNKDGPYESGDGEGALDMYDGPGGEMLDDYEEGYEEVFDADGFPIRGGMRRGRMPARGMGRRGAMPILDGPFPIPPPPGMLGPPMGPAPVLVPAPGAGPMGPFVWSTMPPGGAPLPMDMDVPIMGRGRGGMRGRPRGRLMGPPGSKLDPRGIREYYDLDAPQNNRTVLDYGDL